jgi:hypothetical protein
MSRGSLNIFHNTAHRLQALGFALVFPLLMGAQSQDSLRLSLSLPVRTLICSADHLGNIYTINENHSLEKYAPDGRLLSRYTNNRLGVPNAIDVSNPLKILLWFADFRMAVLLDRSLTELGQLDLLETGSPEVRILASARDGHFWLYDEVALKLKKIGADGRTIFESPPLNTIVSGKISFQRIIDYGDRIYAVDDQRGIWVFDPYAQYIQLMTNTQQTQFQIKDGYIYFLTDQALVFESIRPGERKSIPLPPEAISNKARISLGPAEIMISLGNQLQVFRF